MTRPQLLPGPNGYGGPVTIPLPPPPAPPSPNSPPIGNAAPGEAMGGSPPPLTTPQPAR